MAKFSWPATTTVIAWLALVVSGVQLLFSVPILTQFYFHPDLVVASSRSGPKDKLPFTTFNVSNAGNTPATKIEIGFILHPGAKVSLSPAIAANIVEQEQAMAGVFKLVRVEVERLSPREAFMVIVSSGTPKPSSKAEITGQLAAGFALSQFPHFSFVRSAEGPGRYVPSPGEKTIWSGTWKPQK